MKHLFVLSLLFVTFFAFGQGITLQEAIELGLQNRVELKNQQLVIKKNQNEVDQLKSAWKPQVSANADLRWNTQLQTTILPFDITGQNVEGNTELQFGLPFNNLLALNAEQKIYDANKKVDLSLNMQNERIDELTLDRLKKDIAKGITQAYYKALYQKERLFYRQKQLETLKVDYDKAEEEYNEGTLLENDFLRVRLDYKNAEASLEQAKERFEIDLLTLKNEIRVDLTADFKPSSTLQDLLEKAKLQIAEQAIEEPIEVQIEMARNELFKLQKDKAGVQMKPSVSAFGNYSLLQLNDQFNPFQSGTWFPFNYVGLSVNIPIFNGFQSRISQNTLTLDQLATRNTIEDIENQYAYRRMTAKKEISNAQVDLETALANIELGEKVLVTSQVQLANGVSTPAQLKNSEYALQVAQENYLQAVYQFLLADIKWKEAFGLF